MLFLAAYHDREAVAAPIVAVDVRGAEVLDLVDLERPSVAPFALT